ncbi:MAG: phosphotransferase family protein [Acetobacteraceae bacterium]|nr:phosphotransferase family protein [Acetobacteraceae bacterium]
MVPPPITPTLLTLSGLAMPLFLLFVPDHPRLDGFGEASHFRRPPSRKSVLSDQMPADLFSVGKSFPLDWDAVRAHLAPNGLRLESDPPPRQFSGGLANVNFLVHVDGKPCVLRRPPAGQLPAGAHDMAREHRILSPLADALPFVPRSLHLCEDTSVIGVKFQILEYRAGLVVRATLPPVLRDRPKVGSRLAQVLLETLSALHAVDPASIGLDDLGRPEGFLARAVAGWRKRSAAVHYDANEALLRDLGVWLEAHLVPEGVPALLHNDFKLDNMILDPADLHAVGVVDWDQGTRGDPLFDFATLLSYWTEKDDHIALHDMAQMPSVEAGFPPRSEAVKMYAAMTGRDMSNFKFYRVLALYKLGVIFLQLGHRYRIGQTSDARYQHLSRIGSGILEFTHDVVADRAF